MFKTKKLHARKFWYRLTEWQENVPDLIPIIVSLEIQNAKYGHYYIIKRSPDKRFYAIFTVGENYNKGPLHDKCDERSIREALEVSPPTLDKSKKI